MNSTYMKPSILSFLKKSTPIEKIFYLLTFALIIIIIANYASHQTIEGFKENKNFITKTGIDVYDNFYVSVYDDLLYSSIKNNYEIGEIINKVGPTQNSKILDIGSGTGHHVALFADQGYDAIGIDLSPAMIQKANDNYSSLKFIQDDALNSMIFPPNSFHLITCLYFTLYYIDNKRQFFDNCMKWLHPGGSLAIHLVDKHNFNPIVPAGDPLTLISAQTFAKERITSTVVDFDTHEYKANFTLDTPNKATLHETFKEKKKPNIRKNEHLLHMNSQKEILSQAKAAGFVLTVQIDLIKCEYENQYIYILQKPN